MTENFIPYKQAFELKELAFDEPCFAGYCNDGKLWYPAASQRNSTNAHRTYKKINHQNSHITKAPLFQQAFKWFREKHNLHPSFTRYSSRSIKYNPMIFPGVYEVTIIDETNVLPINVGDYNSHEEAELECLRKLIEIVKNK